MPIDVPPIRVGYECEDGEFADLVGAATYACERHTPNRTNDSGACTCESLMADASFIRHLLYVRRKVTPLMTELAEHRAAVALGLVISIKDPQPLPDWKDGDTK